MLTINIVTLFPNFFDSPLKTGVLGRVISSGLLKLRFVNPRDFTEDIHKTVDDAPFGGGDGMVMMYEPLKKSMEFLSTLQTQSKEEIKQKVIYLSPQGKKWNYQKAREWGEKDNEEKTIICGRYAGVDQRFISEYVEEEISVGDYVLTGGETALLVILDSISRFIKGALGNESSAVNESFEQKQLLEAPQWTRPREISGYKIPEIVLSGHHKNIKQFQYLMSLLITAIKRPDLLSNNAIKKDLSEAINMAESLSEEELKSCGLLPESLNLLKQ